MSVEMLPAHILAHQTTSTSVFVTSLYDKPYVIDPMTFILQNPKSAHLSGGSLRPSVAKLFADYHPTLEEKVMDLGDDEALKPTSYPKLAELCANCLKFQTSKVSDSVGETGAAKYLKRYRKTKAVQPRLLIAPYFYFLNPSDRFYAMSLECARICRDLAKGQEVAPVILCRASSLNAAATAKIVADYKGFGTIFLWIDGFAQSQAQETDIKNVRLLIRSLHDQGSAVEALYGGYLMICMRFDGLRAISHGILYTQSKTYTLSPGSGGAPERYYIPGIWEFRSMSQADLIMHLHPDLICNCAVCAQEFRGNPDNILKFVDNPELLRRHFLTVRRTELDRIESSAPQKEAAKFMQSHGRYHASISALPNPDAIVSQGLVQGLDYLRNWSTGITAEL